MKPDEIQGKIDNLNQAIPNKLELDSVRQLMQDLVNPHYLVDTRTSIVDGTESTATFFQVCDHMEVRTVPDDSLRPGQRLEIAEETVEDHGGDLTLNNIFSQKAGEKIVVIKIRENMSMVDLVTLIDTIKSLSTTSLKSPKDIEQIKEWSDKVNSHSKNLNLAALAMKRIIDLADKEDGAPHMAGFLSDVAELTYNLGEAINLDSRNEDKASLTWEYLATVSYLKTENAVNGYLAEGLRYARFGDKERVVDHDPNVAFGKMVRLYRRLFNTAEKTNNETEVCREIMTKIVTNTIPKHLEIVKKENEESRQMAPELPMMVVEQTVLRGIEKTYQELTLPPPIKELLATDVKNINREDLIVMLIHFRLEMGDELLRSIYYKYCPESYGMFVEKVGNDGVANKLVKAMFEPESEEQLRVAFVAWKEDLQTLGLGKENIHSFSEWFEDPNFFDDDKIEELKKYHQQNRLSWEDSAIKKFIVKSIGRESKPKSVSEVVKFYQDKITNGDIDLDEYSNFQHSMLILVADQMRTVFGGWDERTKLGALKDSSPSKIIESRLLNCVGRSNLLQVVGEKLGCRGSGASSLSHVATFFEFPNGGKRIIDPSRPHGIYSLEVEEIIDTNGLLNDGERLFADKANDQDRYLIGNNSEVATQAVLGNFLGYIREVLPIEKSAYDYQLDSTSIINYLGRVQVNYSLVNKLEDMAKSLQEPIEKVAFVLKKLKLICPNFDEETGYSDDFKGMIRRLNSDLNLG